MKNFLLTALAALLIWSIGSTSAEACCAVTRDGSLVVNADQTVIMIWDHDTRTQHFIRQANFKTDATDVGFIVPFSFQTARPLFPYREPDSSIAKRELNAPSRLLRIYFISDARYLGALDGGGQWTGRAVWVNDISRHRERLLRELGLPASTGPSKWVLTEFEDRWPYAQASGDLYFSADPDQSLLDTRSTISQPTHDVALLGFLVVFSACRLGRRSRRGEQTRMGEV